MIGQQSALGRSATSPVLAASINLQQNGALPRCSGTTGAQQNVLKKAGNGLKVRIAYVQCAQPFPS